MNSLTQKLFSTKKNNNLHIGAGKSFYEYFLIGLVIMGKSKFQYFCNLIISFIRKD